jgi:N-acetylglutamate synthase/N-acetylornithine aminotransferase
MSALAFGQIPSCLHVMMVFRLYLCPGMHAGLRASGPKADLALIFADSEAVAAGVFTTNVMCAAPVIFDRQILEKSDVVRAVRKFASSWAQSG